MRRLQTAFVLLLALAVPIAAHAQTGDRPATQLFLAPTGRALPKGQGYVKGIGLGIPCVQGGITNRFSIGIGMPLIALGQGIVITPKLQVQRSEKHSTSVGLVEVLTSDGSVGVGYVAHTIELPEGAIHITAMTPMTRATGARDVLVMIGAERRINDRVTFMTENYVTVGGLPIVSGGVRIKAPHTTWDFGLFVPTGFEFGARPMPMINGGWKF